MDKKWVPEIILFLMCFIVTHLFKELIGLNLYLDFMMADLLDFKNLPFSFTLEFNMLKDEQARGKIVRVPPLYNL